MKNSTKSFIRKLEAMNFHYKWHQYTDRQIHEIYMERCEFVRKQMLKKLKEEESSEDTTTSVDSTNDTDTGDRRINPDTGEREVLTGLGWEKEYD